MHAFARTSLCQALLLVLPQSPPRRGSCAIHGDGGRRARSRAVTIVGVFRPLPRRSTTPQRCVSLAHGGSCSATASCLSVPCVARSASSAELRLPALGYCLGEGLTSCPPPPPSPSTVLNSSLDRYACGHCLLACFPHQTQQRLLLRVALMTSLRSTLPLMYS